MFVLDNPEVALGLHMLMRCVEQCFCDYKAKKGVCVDNRMPNMDKNPSSQERGSMERGAASSSTCCEGSLPLQFRKLYWSHTKQHWFAMQVDMKPASDVIAGAMARAASQGTIHPLDTLKVQLQSGKGRSLKPALSKISQLVPPQGDLLSHCYVYVISTKTGKAKRGPVADGVPLPSAESAHDPKIWN